MDRDKGYDIAARDFGWLRAETLASTPTSCSSATVPRAWRVPTYNEAVFTGALRTAVRLPEADRRAIGVHAREPWLVSTTRPRSSGACAT